MRTILILANGEWHDGLVLAKLAAKASYIIAVDGAWAKLKKLDLDIKVDLLIGDLDSLNQSKLEVPNGVEVKKYPREKDRTDLELAIDEAKKLDPEKMVIFGAFGKRIDHLLGNIFLLEKLTRWEISGVFIDNYRRIYSIYPQKPLRVDVKKGDIISLLPLTGNASGIFTKGLKYKLENGRLNRSSTLGISNVATASKLVVKIDQGVLLAIHTIKNLTKQP